MPKKGAMLEKRNREVPKSKLEEDIKLYRTHELPVPAQIPIYLPHPDYREGFLKTVRGYWAEVKPKSAFEYAAYAANPSAYLLWKMPKETHAKLNTLLGTLAPLSEALGPEAVVGVGIAYAISQVIYGLKTRSGKHLLSGLEGVVKNTSGVNHPLITESDRSQLRSTNKAAKSLLDAIKNQKSEEN